MTALTSSFTIVTALLTTLLASPAWAQDEMEKLKELSSNPKELSSNSFEILPYFWMAGMKGSVGVRGLSADYGVRFSDIVDDLDFGVMAAAKLRLHHWAFSADFNYINLSADGETPGNLFSGSRIDAQLYLAALTVGYCLPTYQGGMVELYAGARGWSVDVDVDFNAGLLPGTSVSQKKSWVDPIIGANFDFALGGAWGLNVIVDVGGFDVSSFLTGQVIVGINVKCSDHWRIALAYRYLADDFEDGNFRWQVAEHGVLLGIGLRF